MKPAVSGLKGPRELQCGVKGSFYRIKNEEQEINTEPRVGLTFRDGLTAYTVFLVKWSIYRDMKTNFQFTDMVPGAGAPPSWA